MVLRMAGSMDGDKSQIADDEFLRVRRDSKLFLRHGQELAPKRFHAVAVDAAGARDQLFRVEQVRCTEGMHVNLRPLPGPPTGGAGVVEMNVRQQDVSHVSGSQPFFCQTSLEGR